MRRADPLPKITIRASGRIGLNAAGYEALGRPDRVALLYDPGARIVGLQATTPDDPSSFKVSHAGSKSSQDSYVSAIGFFDHYGLWPGATTGFRATFTDGILHADVTELFAPLFAA